MTTCAIMQPYFIPYAGYFRLFAEADVFVVFNDVQYIRRGFINRNKLTSVNGQPEWFTIPVVKKPIDTLVSETTIDINTLDKLWPKYKNKFKCLSSPVAQELGIYNVDRRLLFYDVILLSKLSELLGFNQEVFLSSDIDIISSETDSMSMRIINICQTLGCDTYINNPGGMKLYSKEEFARYGIDLKFLKPYEGSFLSILQRLADESVKSVRHEILQNTILM